MNTISAEIPKFSLAYPMVFELYQKKERFMHNASQLSCYPTSKLAPLPLKLSELASFSLTLKKLSREVSTTEEDQKLYKFAANFFGFQYPGYQSDLSIDLTSDKGSNLTHLINHMMVFDENEEIFIPVDIARFVVLRDLHFMDIDVTDRIQTLLYANDMELVPYLLKYREDFFVHNLNVDTSLIQSFLSTGAKLNDALRLREFVEGSEFDQSDLKRQNLICAPLFGPNFFCSFYDAFYPEIINLIESMSEEERREFYDHMTVLEGLAPMQQVSQFQRIKGLIE